MTEQRGIEEGDAGAETFGVETAGVETMDEADALVSRLRVIEGQPIETRATAFSQIYESLQATLGGDAQRH